MNLRNYYRLSIAFIIVTFATVLTPCMASQQAKWETSKPLTQYALVEVNSYGVGFRSNMAQMLKSIGFTVKTYSRPQYLDEMESYKALSASRKSNGGVTTVEMTNGEDQVVAINFGTQAEASDFLKSVTGTGYTKSGGVYYHPQNDMSKIGIKITGKRVKIICPNEMFPYSF